MFKLIRCSARLRIVDAILESKIGIDNNINNKSKVKFSYINDKKFSDRMNSKVKKMRYNKGIR